MLLHLPFSHDSWSKWSIGLKSLIKPKPKTLAKPKNNFELLKQVTDLVVQKSNFFPVICRPSIFGKATFMLSKIRAVLESISEYSGRLAAWSTSIMVWLIVVDVIMRYFFSFSFIWIVELEIYFFAFSFLFTMGYAFKYDKHVRVDLFYTKLPPVGKAWVNLIGGVLLLIPFCVVAIWVCSNYAMTSFRIGENSPQPGGLPALYVLKFSVVLGFVFLLLQAVASVLESIETIFGTIGLSENGATNKLKDSKTS